MRSDLVALHNNFNHICSAEDMRDSFHAHLTTAAQPTSIAAKVESQHGTIRVSCLNRVVEAVPRTVRVEDSDYAIEYTFTIDFENQKVLIWQMYLFRSGVLSRSTESDSNCRICDFDNTRVNELIADAVCEALLQSVVFAPTAFN